MNNNIKEEVWKDVEGYEGQYLVSNTGKVKSIDRTDEKGYTHLGVDKKAQDNGKGYLSVALYKHNIERKKYIHRLVATAFIPNPENLPEVNHKDGNKSNNIVDNLEWVTTSDNILHSYEVLNRRSNKNNPIMSHKIAMLDDKGNILKIYPSMREAERQLNLSNGVISKGLQNDWKTNGHWWKRIK